MSGERGCTDTVGAYRALYTALGGDWSEACAAAMRWLERDVFGRWPHLGDELRTMAAARSVTPTEIAFVWCRSELMGGMGLWGGECTGASMGPVIGQTWDWHPSFAGTLGTRVVEGHRGALVVVAEDGQPAKLGLNASGVWVGLNWLAGGRHIAAGDIPIHVAIRVVLEEATSCADAADRLSKVPLAQAAAFPVYGPDGSVIVERHPGAAAAVIEQNGAWLVHANHVADEGVAAAQGSDPWADESRGRASRLADQLQHGRHDARSLAAALVAVSYEADPTEPPLEQIGTLAAVVATPSEGEVVLCSTRPTIGARATAHSIHGSVRHVTWGE